jgi:hypothetical protein
MTLRAEVGRERELEMQNENKPSSGVVRPVDRSILGPENQILVPLTITDDRNKNPIFGAWLCTGGCGKFYDACECEVVCD